jgi:hypothetical protein
LLAAWRRLIRDGGGPDLTQAEAASLFEDVTPRSAEFRQREPIQLDDSSSAVALRDLEALQQELQTARRELEAALAQNQRLSDELEAAEKALHYMKTEVSNLWRLVTTRSVRDAHKEAEKQAREQAREHGHEETAPSPAILDLEQERERIQGKIANVRSLARRRRWPWAQTG